MTQLKKCPFCDGKALLTRSYSAKKEWFYAFVFCTECGSRGRSFRSFDDPAEHWEDNDAALGAVRTWNMRSGHTDDTEAKLSETGAQEATE